MITQPHLIRAAFGDDFTWGVASAAYQIEGAHDRDGKGPSIWDTFTHRSFPRPVKDRSTGDTACEFYDRYPADLALATDMGFGAKRFSVSWPRVLPTGTAPVNQAGLDYYSRLVDACLDAGLEPWVTLYHWDLPQALQERGGWTNRDIVGWFADYVNVVASALGDRVRHWMVFNEPLSFTSVGELVGVHAPGKRSLRGYLASVHHVNLSQAAGAAALRAIDPTFDVGTTQYLTHVERTGDTALHRLAERSGDAFVNRAFIEPNLGMGYPTDDCRLLRGVERFIRDGDIEAMNVDWDFLGVQYYTRLRTPPLPIPLLWTAPLFGHDRDRYEVTETGWEVRPDGLYDVLQRAHSYGRFPRLIITENGAAFPDALERGGNGDDLVADSRRIAFYRRHLEQVLRAKNDGLPIDGYFCWSLTDNFEWAEGYRPRFGLIYVDYPTQRRVVKDSGRWFTDFLGAGLLEDG